MNQRYVGVCAATFVFLASGVWAKGVTVPQEEYRALVGDVRSFLSDREITEARAKNYAARLRKISAVTDASGRRFAVDTKDDADALDAVTGTTPDKKLQARFAALDEQLTQEKSAKAVADPEALARKILAGREFAGIKPDKKIDPWDFSALPAWFRPIANFFKPALKWIAGGFEAFGKWFGNATKNMFRAIGKFFRWIFNKFPQAKWNPKNPFASIGNGILLALYFLATVAAVVGFYFLTRYLLNLYDVKTGRNRRAGVLSGDLDLTQEGITDPVSSARERASEGDYRSAIRLIYIASLWKLGESGVLTLEKNRTNWEYQRALRKKSSTVHDDFLPATRLFDRVWYGRQAGTQSEFQTVSQIYDALPTQDVSAATDIVTPVTTEGSAT
ncbi:MAG: DUF4129 domain-containing protein [Armatimonadetes bacterium]|nr:DUF4129 domain-containing protein [Armatimonadota bacterium]